MDPVLGLRSRLGVLPRRPADSPLPAEELESLRRIVLFVCIVETSIGVVGRDLNAAAAAAEDRDAFEARCPRKA